MRSQTTTAAASGVANPQMEMNICFSLGFAPAVRVETVADRYIFMNLHHSCNIYIYIYIYIAQRVTIYFESAFRHVIMCVAANG